MELIQGQDKVHFFECSCNASKPKNKNRGFTNFSSHNTSYLHSLFTSADFTTTPAWWLKSKKNKKNKRTLNLLLVFCSWSLVDLPWSSLMRSGIRLLALGEQPYMVQCFSRLPSVKIATSDWLASCHQQFMSNCLCPWGCRKSPQMSFIRFLKGMKLTAGAEMMRFYWMINKTDGVCYFWKWPNFFFFINVHNI